MRDGHVFSMTRAMPRMSWSPINLWNTYQRLFGARKADTDFSSGNDRATLYGQRWKAKALVRAFHGDYIPEKVFKRWYLPDTLPDVRPKRQVFGDDTADLQAFALRKRKETDYQAEQEEKGLPPVGSLMFSELERRIDTFVFRCCFAHSIYEARRLVIHGDVTLNGVKHQNANTRLAPGDMVHVKPSSIRFLDAPKETVVPPTESEAEAESDTESTTKTKTNPEIPKKQPLTTPFNLPDYAAPWLFIPAYIEVNFKTCTAIYVRHPTARPGYSEIATPYDADGDVLQYAWEWYAKIRPRIKTKRQLARMPEDRAEKLRESTLVKPVLGKKDKYGFGKERSRLVRAKGRL